MSDRTKVVQLAVLLTSEDLAQLAKVEVRTVHIWRQRGTGPPYVEVTPGCIRYRPEDVEKWLAGRVKTWTGGRRAEER